jgi:hypothetical protein
MEGSQLSGVREESWLVSDSQSVELLRCNSYELLLLEAGS